MTGKCKECRYFNETENYCNDYLLGITGPVVSCEGFSPNTNITLADLSDDEKAACLELVEKMRAAKKKAALIEEARQKLFIDYNNCIDTIGPEETRKIIQEINRLLRWGLVSED